MSKRDDESSSADLEVGMTTAERRRRRRRGALRVPSDNVPRRAPTSPPVVAPVPEDPALAMSIAYSFSSEASEPVPRHTLDELSGSSDASRRTLQQSGAISASGATAAPQLSDDRANTDFTPIAPQNAPTLIEPPSSPVESADFEVKTREMAAVDLEALGLQELEPRSAVRAPIDTSVTSAQEVPSVIVDEPDVISAFRDRRVKTDPMVDGSPDDDAPAHLRAARDADVDVDVGGLDAETPAETVRPIAKPPVSPGEMSSPGIALTDDDLETTSIHSIPTRPAEPAILGAAPTPPVLPGAQAAASGRPRLKTVALSEEDLEEVLEAARAASQPGAGSTKAPVTTIPGLGPSPGAAPAAPAAPAALADSKRTQPLSALDLEPVPAPPAEPPSADASGEFAVDVDVDVAPDSDRHDVRRPSVPPPLPPAPVPASAGTLAAPLVAAPAALVAPPPMPPPAPTVPLAAGTPPPPPAAAKTDGAHHAPPPPPPAATERHRVPPTPPVPTKKHSTPVAPAVAAASAAAKDKAPRGKPWFVDLFDEDYLRTLPFLTAQATQSEAEFVIDAMALSPGAQLLDVGCGYGRHAMELAARGYHVVGLNLSTPLLVRGGEESHRRGLTINFVRGDMRELDFDSQFDGAYCLFSTFGYFDDETNKKALSNIARALRPGGRVLIEILNRDYVIADLPTRVWWEGDGCVVLEEVELNYFSSRIQVNRSVVFDDGRQLEQEISIRAYALHEIGKLMHAAGFRVLEVSGGYQTRGRFFGNQSRHIIVLAERKDPSAT